MDELELVKQKTDIVELISEYLPLKKAGVNFKAPCPFHQEKTPSFVVSPERQIWHCFGCQKGGDAFKFLMEKEGIEFKEALEILAKKAGVVLERKSSVKKDFKDRLLEANLKAQEFFHYILIKHPLGKHARDYLIKRGISDETIKNFGLGYAPNSWESLTKFLLKKGFTVSDLTESGLAVPNKTACYDRFRGRIIFPLVDVKDRIIGFSGRVIYQAEPKYINTPQTLLFDKSNFLYGINKSKGEIRSKKTAILVEGEMDMLLSFQAGVKNIVASKGTALTEGQIELLKRLAENIVLCFDTDLAGDFAARRGIEMADKAGLNIQVIQVKGGKDPAELVKKDPQLWQQATETVIPLYDYYLQSIEGRYDTKDPINLRKIASELIPIWAKISDDLVREHYTQKLSALLRTDEQILRQDIEKERQGAPKVYAQIFKEPKDDQVSGTHSRRELLEEYLVALMLHIPKGLTYVPNFPETLFIGENWRQLYVLLVLYLDSISFKSGAFEINDFLKGVPPELASEVDRLYLTQLDDKLEREKFWQKETGEVVLELKKALIKASLERLSLEIKNAQQFGKIELLDSLSRRFRDLSVKLKNL